MYINIIMIPVISKLFTGERVYGNKIERSEFFKTINTCANKVNMIYQNGKK